MKIVICSVALLLSGCVSFFSPSAPDMKQTCPSYPASCLVLDMPPPIPETVHIRIEPGGKVYADSGGQELIRSYASLRRRIAQWHHSRP